MAGPDVLFLGPSLDHATARALHPEAIVLPPAAMGDVLGAAHRYRPHAIGLVDGTFLRNMAVFHKEILYAIDQGIWVLGSSSMGALRAAELEPYGMVGVGGIFDALMSGELEDDDEVALTHASAADGFRPLSDALVTIRAALHDAVEAGLLGRDESAELAARQKARWFPDRHLAAVLSDAREVGVDPERIARLKAFLRSFDGDPKRRDAIALVEAMRALPADPVPEDGRPGVVMSGVFMAALARDVVVETADGQQTTFDQIRRYAVLSEPDYGQVVSRARERLVLMAISTWLAGPLTAEETAAARDAVCVLRGLAPGDFDAWALENDLDDRGQASLLSYVGHARRMERTWLGRTRLGMVTEQFLHELRLSGRYGDVKAASALQEEAAATVQFSPPPTAGQLMTTVSRLTGWQRPPDLRGFLEEQELGGLGELLLTMDTVVRAHHAFFGTGVVEVEGAEPVRAEIVEPMMTRGE